MLNINDTKKKYLKYNELIFENLNAFDVWLYIKNSTFLIISSIFIIYFYVTTYSVIIFY